MYEDPNVEEQTVVAVITFASDQANEESMQAEIRARVSDVVNELGHDVEFVSVASLTK